MFNQPSSLSCTFFYLFCSKLAADSQTKLLADLDLRVKWLEEEDQLHLGEPQEEEDQLHLGPRQEEDDQ